MISSLIIFCAILECQQHEGPGLNVLLHCSANVSSAPHCYPRTWFIQFRGNRKLWHTSQV